MARSAAMSTEEDRRMSQDKLAFIDEDIANLKEAGLFTNIRTIESAQGAWLIVDGKRVQGH